jgi:hypothetical protein
MDFTITIGEDNKHKHLIIKNIKLHNGKQKNALGCLGIL